MTYLMYSAYWGLRRSYTNDKFVEVCNTRTIESWKGISKSNRDHRGGYMFNGDVVV